MKSADNILFHDNHLLVVEKPANLSTQRDPERGERSLEDQLIVHLTKMKGRPPFLRSIHRLDRCTTGLVIFALSSKATSRLALQMREGLITKKYLAVVEEPMPLQDTLIHYHRHGDHRALIFDKEQPNSKRAELSYQKIATEGDFSLLLVQLASGRYHQIRAQLAHIGHPLLADVRYGGREIPLAGIALHASSLSFHHPTTKEQLHFSSLPPFTSLFPLFVWEKLWTKK